MLFAYVAHSQQIKLNFSNNLIDSSSNHYLVDTNYCGSTLTFCDDASGNNLNAFQFDGLCSMKTDSFSMTNTNYAGMSLSFYMNKDFDSDTIQYGLFHFYKGPFLVYALHDSMFVIVTDTTNNNYTYGVPCPIPNGEWFCGVVTLRDFGDIDFYFNKTKYNAGATNYKILRRACEPGFCYWFSLAPEIWANKPFKGKMDDVRVWNWPSDSINVDEICTKTIVPVGITSFEKAGIKVYPNPALDNVVFETKENGLLEMYDMIGRKLFAKKMYKGINSVNIEGFIQGQYVLQFKTDKNSYSQILLIH